MANFVLQACVCSQDVSGNTLSAVEFLVTCVGHFQPPKLRAQPHTLQKPCRGTQGNTHRHKPYPLPQLTVSATTLTVHSDNSPAGFRPSSSTMRRSQTATLLIQTFQAHFQVFLRISATFIQIVLHFATTTYAKLFY